MSVDEAVYGDGADLVQLASRLAAILGPQDSVIIGGVCANLLGIPRFTRDVDLAVSGTPEAAWDRLIAAGVGATIRRGDLTDPLPWVIEGRVAGVKFQILPADRVGDPRAALPIDEIGARILTAPQFIDAKLRAGGWKDLYDAAWLARRHPDLAPVAEAAAERWQQVDRYRMAYDDPRLADDVREHDDA
jgi:hypothetical protein